MKHTMSLLALVGFGLLAATGRLCALEIDAPATTVLGDTVTVYLPGTTNANRVTLSLSSDEGGIVGEAPGFPYLEEGKIAGWVAIIGIPTTIASGPYRLYVSVATPGGVISKASPITIETREFRHESISLDEALTTLQTEQTALKTRQAEELWQILTTFDERAVYQDGPLIVPVADYRVSGPYAERRVFVFVDGGDQHSIHQGIDLAVPAGTPIKAAGAGKVVYVGSMIMTGNTVVIEQLPGVFSLYFHMERAEVTEGQVVSQGQTIGYVGSTGLATGPHLHWQIEVDGVAVNP